MAGAIFIDSAALAVTFAESATCTVKFAAPAEEGVPETMPLGSRVSPPGSVPWLTVQVYGGMPPEALKLTSPYVTPTSPSWNAALEIASGDDGDGLAGCVTGDAPG